MSYLLLLTFIIGLIIITYFTFKKDILSPSFITYVIYLISLICSIIGLLYWNDVKNINSNTLIVLILGLVSFGCGELVSRKILSKKSYKNSNSTFNDVKHISLKKTYVLLFLIIVSIIYIILEIRKVCMLYGFDSSNLSNMLNYYRKANDLLSGGSASAVYDISSIAKQCLKFCCVVCVFFGYLFINSILNKEPKKNRVIYLIGTIISLFSSLLSTGRSIFMHLVIALLVIFVVLYRKKYSDKDSFKKLIKYILIIIVVSCCLLFLLMPLLGRKTDEGIIDSVSFALGAHIPSLDKKINDTVDYTSTAYGSKITTFNNFYAFLYNSNIIENYEPSYAVWYPFRNYSSNTYTSLSSYYNDYGIIGVIILQFIFGFIVSTLYLNVINKENVLSLLTYSYFFYTVVDQFRGDQFYGLLTPSTIAYVILLLIIYFYMFKFNLKKR